MDSQDDKAICLKEEDDDDKVQSATCFGVWTPKQIILLTLRRLIKLFRARSSRQISKSDEISSKYEALEDPKTENVQSDEIAAIHAQEENDKVVICHSEMSDAWSTCRRRWSSPWQRSATSFEDDKGLELVLLGPRC